MESNKKSYIEAIKEISVEEMESIVEIDKEIHETLLKLERALHIPMKRLVNYALKEFFNIIECNPDILSEILGFKSIVKDIFTNESDQVSEDLILSNENEDLLRKLSLMANVDPQAKLNNILDIYLNSAEIGKDQNDNITVDNF